MEYGQLKKLHGVWATKEIANEQTERVSLSLEKAGYIL